MSKTAKITASIAILVVAAILYVVRSGGATNDFTSRTGYDALLQCRACNNQFKATLDVADEPPFKCSKCGKREAWGLMKCHSCNNVFLPDISGNPPRPPVMPTCPKCKSQQVGSAPVE